MTSLNPVYTVGEQIAEVIRRHEGLGRRAALEKTVDMLRAGADPQSPAPRARLSAPVLRRHAPARDDRHGALVQPQAPDRRRAHHRARRDHPGADPGASGRSQVALRHGHHADHPCHGRGRGDGAARGGDVCRQGDRGGLRSSSSSASRGTPTRRVSSARSRASTGRRPTRRGWRPSPGVVPSLLEPGARLPLRAALPPFAAAICREAMPPLREIDAGHKVACVLAETLAQ